MLRQKGPLLEDRRSSLSTKVRQHDVKASSKAASGGEIAFEVAEKSKKKAQEAKQFDSSHVLSPFLDPKIIERRIMASKRNQK